MEGRAPGTPGETKTVAYMQGQFKALGLKPGNPDGTYLQNVDLIGYKAHPTASFTAGGKTISLKYPDDFIANSRHDAAGDEGRQLRRRVRRLRRRRAGVRLGRLQGRGREGQDAPHARERSADPRPNDTAARPGDVQGPGDDLLRSLDVQVRDRVGKGAAAAIIIHETGPAGYPYGVVSGSNSQELRRHRRPTPTKRVAGRGLDHARQGEGDSSRPAGRTSILSRRPRRRKDFKPVALERQGDVPRRRSTHGSPVAQRGRRSSKAPTRRTSTSSTRRTGTTSARTRRSRATRSTTARPTTPRAARRCSRSPRPSRCCRRLRSARSSSSP